MKYLLLSILFFLISYKGFAQQADSTTKPTVIRLICKSTINPDSVTTLLIVKGKIFPYQQMSAVNLNLIKNITVLKGAESAALYGSRGANGAIVIDFDKDVKWVPIKKIMQKNRIAPIHQNLPLVYQSAVVKTDSLLVGRNTKYKLTVANSKDLKLKQGSISGDYILVSDIKD